MDLKIGIRTVELLKKISEGKVKEIDFVKYTPQKQKFPEDTEYEQSFERSDPEAEGISSDYLDAFLQELQQTPETCVHSLMILRNGKVITEGSFPPYRQEVWHISHSMCKSVVALAIGIAIDEGRLDVNDRVSELLKDRKKPITILLKKNLTVKNLLMMSSGILANEVTSATGNEWTKGCLESTQRFEPGKKFHYNSMNTYLLSVILCEITKQSLMDYLKPRLFDPLGIKKVFWELSPEGIEKGGWGLYLTLEDMAKLGQLCLQYGNWKGQQLVPKQWIEEMSKYRIDSTQGKGKYGYGYQVWMGKRPGAYLFNGMLGQIVYIIPDLQMVFAFTGGSDNLYRDNATNFLIEKYFDEDFVPREQAANPKAVQHLRSTCRHLQYPTADRIRNRYAIGGTLMATPTYEMERQAVHLEGRAYEMPPQFVGLLPIFIQSIHNNYSKGLSRFRFYRQGEDLILETTEGEDINRIPLGFSEIKYCDIEENGETYLAAVNAVMIRNEDNVPVLKVELSLIETANTRIIKFFFEQTRVRVQFLESPGIEMMLNGIESMMSRSVAPAMVTSAMAAIDQDYVECKIKKAFEPVFDLIPVEFANLQGEK